MAIYLTEKDVQGLLNYQETLRVLEEAFRAYGNGDVVNRPRLRIPLSGGSYNLMAAAWYSKKVVGHKSYTATSNGARFHVMLYDAEGRGLLAVVEAGFLGKVRTGCASALATRFMAKGTGVAAIIGTGNQAESQLEALVAVGHATSARVYSRTPEQREMFASKMSERLGIEVVAVNTPEMALDAATSATLITNSFQPVLKADWLRPGLHVNAAGNNTWLGQEIETSAMGRFDVIVADDVDQARIESGDLMRAAETGKVKWGDVIPLGDVVSGKRNGRSSSADMTLFESQGVGIEDVAVAEHVYKAALEKGTGTRLPTQ